MILNYLLLFGLCLVLGHFFETYDAPMIKQMWTPSFALYSGATAFFFLISFYALNDVWLRGREDELEREQKAASRDEGPEKKDTCEALSLGRLRLGPSAPGRCI